MRSSCLWSVVVLVTLTGCGMTDHVRVTSPTLGEEIQSLMSPDGFSETVWTLALARQGYTDEALWVDGDLLFIQTRDEDGRCVMQAIELASGVPQWVLVLPESPTARPASNAGTVAFVCGNQAVVVRRDSGERTSQGPAYHLDFWASSPPAVTENSLYMGSYVDSRVESVALATGYSGWHFAMNDLVRVAPVVAGAEADRLLVLASEGGQVVGLSLRNADSAPPQGPRWTLATGRNEIDIVGAGEIVYLASGDSFLYAINALGGTIVWKYAGGAPFEGALALAGDTLFARTASEFVAVDANSGDLRWSAPGLDHLVVAQADRVACLTFSGNISVRDGSDGHEVTCLSSPVLKNVAVNPESDLLVFGDGKGHVTAVR